jgi:hypothetical protein
VINTSETTASTAYADLTTLGPQVSVTTGTQALAIWGARMSNSTGGQTCFSSVAVTGSTTVAASDNWSLWYNSPGSNQIHRSLGFHWFTSLTAGSNVFTQRYRVDAATGAFHLRELLVIPF